MKIIIVTEREILDEDYLSWSQSALDAGCRFDPTELLVKKEISYTTDLGYTKATTTMRIVEG